MKMAFCLCATGRTPFRYSIIPVAPVAVVLLLPMEKTPDSQHYGGSRSRKRDPNDGGPLREFVPFVFRVRKREWKGDLMIYCVHFNVEESFFKEGDNGKVPPREGLR